MNEVVAKAIKDACRELGQSDGVANRICKWIDAAATDALSAEEQAERVGQIRNEINLEAEQ